MKRHARIFMLGAALIAVGNVAALGGVAWNRAGEPEAAMVLSERELPALQGGRESSGLVLRLDWLKGDSDWLGPDSLRELGFTEGDELPRAAWIVLEFDGPARQTALAELQAKLAEAEAGLAEHPEDRKYEFTIANTRERLAAALDRNSRLVPIDAGPARDALRQRYSDRSRYLILPGSMEAWRINEDRRVFIRGIDTGHINVPLEYRDAIVAGGRYEVKVAFGRRAEGWILGAGSGE